MLTLETALKIAEITETVSNGQNEKQLASALDSFVSLLNTGARMEYAATDYVSGDIKFTVYVRDEFTNVETVSHYLHIAADGFKADSDTLAYSEILESRNYG